MMRRILPTIEQIEIATMMPFERRRPLFHLIVGVVGVKVDEDMIVPIILDRIVAF
jgi:hypothetical protein